MKQCLYRLYSTLHDSPLIFPDPRRELLIAWINQNGYRTPDFYEMAIRHYRSLPLDRRLMAELFIDELFTENESRRFKQHLARLYSAVEFSWEKVSLPIHYGKSLNSLKNLALKGTIGYLTIQRNDGSDFPASPHPVRPMLIKVTRKQIPAGPDSQYFTKGT